MVIRYDDHAEFQLERRGIAKSWIEETVVHPDETQRPAIFPQAIARTACYAARRDDARRS
jgi:hypothetical protein